MCYVEMKKPVTENSFQSADANKVRVQTNSKKQSRPRYWCLFFKKYPASHCKQGCFLPLDLTGIKFNFLLE